MTDFRSRLIGAWTLQTYCAVSITNPADVVYPLGPDCKGRAIYSHDGYISAYIQSASIKPYSADRGFHASKEDLAAAASKTLAYSGRYELEVHDRNRATVRYDIDLSLPPNWIGQTEIRELEMSEENDGGQRLTKLVLRPPGAVELRGAQRKLEVVTIQVMDAHGAHAELETKRDQKL